MKTVGIIAEYNPFHNGHAYQIAQAKKVTGAQYCIIIMSGNFVQRGAPAIMDKYTRTRAALTGGADLIIELPVHYATASAEYFAAGAAALLDKLGIDCLCFGSECGNIQTLSDTADLLLAESTEYKELLQKKIRSGMPYPQAREAALCALSPHLAGQADILRSPNNILGLEYLKALKKSGSRIIPYTIKRTGASYHDSALQSTCSSALAIRETIALSQDMQLVKDQMPSSVYEIMEAEYGKTFPVFPSDLSSLLAYKLLAEETEGFCGYFDIDESLSDRIRKCLPAYQDAVSFCDRLKTKNTTYTRISRALLHILLNILQTDMDIFCREGYVYYARILGFQKESAPLLSKMKADSSIPLITKLADAAARIFSENGRRMLEQDILASHIYSLLVHTKFGQGIQNEYKRQIITL